MHDNHSLDHVKVKTFFILSLYRDQSKSLTLNCNSSFAWLFLVSSVAGDVRAMLTWFIFFMPLSLPSSSVSTSCTNNHPVLEYRAKLFTHSNQKPASKERIHQQGIVKLSLLASPLKTLHFFLTHPLSLILLPLYNLLTNQVTYSTASRCKPLTKTLWDIVLIMADFVGALLGAVVFHKPKWLL